MSEAIAFDTHRFVKNLTASGFTETQAEALADEQVHLLNSNLATKADVVAVKSEILTTNSDVRKVQADVREVQADVCELQSDVRELQSDVREVKSDVREVKSDVRELQSDVREVKSDVREVNLGLELKIEKARVGLSRWMLTGWVAQTGVLVTLYWYLFSSLPAD